MQPLKKTFIQENLLKLNKKSELVVFEPRLVLPTLTTPPSSDSARGKLWLPDAAGNTGLPLPSAPAGGLFSWEGQAIYHPAAATCC